MTRKMKNSGIEWIGEIPENWEVIRNKYIFDRRNTKVKDKHTEYQLLSLTKKGIVEKDINTFGGKMPASFSTYQEVKEDEIVLCLFDLDVSAVFSGISKYRGMISSAYDVFSFKKNMNPNYYDYLFQLIGFYRTYIMYSKSLRKTINIDNFNSIFSIYPPFEEQNIIVSILDEKISKIDVIQSESKQSIEELKKYKQSLITEAVTKGLDPNAEMKDSGIEWIKEIPNQWKPMRVKYVLFEKSDKSKTGTEEPLSMSQIYGLIPSKDMDSIPNATSNYTGYRIVDKDDLVFNKLKAHLGVFDVSNYNGLVSPDYAVYKAKENYLVHFLKYLFKTPILISEFIKNSRGVGAGLTRLYTNEFFNIKIPLPSIGEQQQIITYLDEQTSRIDKLIADKTKVIEELESYKKSLIYEYVTGKKEM